MPSSLAGSVHRSGATAARSPTSGRTISSARRWSAACERVGVPLERIEDIAAGCVNPAHEGMGDIARWARARRRAFRTPSRRPPSTASARRRCRARSQIAHAIRSDELGVGPRRRGRVDVALGLGVHEGRGALHAARAGVLLDTMWAGAGGPPNPALLARDAYIEMIADGAERGRPLRADARGDRRLRAALPPARRRRRDSGRLAKEIHPVEIPGHPQEAGHDLRARRVHPRRHDGREARCASAAAEHDPDDGRQLVAPERRRQRCRARQRRRRRGARRRAAGAGRLVGDPCARSAGDGDRAGVGVRRRRWSAPAWRPRRSTSGRSTRPSRAGARRPARAAEAARRLRGPGREAQPERRGGRDRPSVRVVGHALRARRSRPSCASAGRATASSACASARARESLWCSRTPRRPLPEPTLEPLDRPQYAGEVASPASPSLSDRSWRRSPGRRGAHRRGRRGAVRRRRSTLSVHRDHRGRGGHPGRGRARDRPARRLWVPGRDEPPVGPDGLPDGGRDAADALHRGRPRRPAPASVRRRPARRSAAVDVHGPPRGTAAASRGSGSRSSARARREPTRRIVEFARRSRLPVHLARPRALRRRRGHGARSARSTPGELPLVRLPGGTELRNPSNGEVSRALGDRPRARRPRGGRPRRHRRRAGRAGSCGLRRVRGP